MNVDKYMRILVVTGVLIATCLATTSLYAWSFSDPTCAPVTEHKNLNILFMLDDSPEVVHDEYGPGSQCTNRCGGDSAYGGCSCDSDCISYGDCCPGICDSCGHFDFCQNLEKPFFDAVVSEAAWYGWAGGTALDEGYPWSIGLGEWSDTTESDFVDCSDNNSDFNTAIQSLSPFPRQGRKITVGAGHACLLRHDGRVECWGDEANGQLLARPGRYTDVPRSFLDGTCGTVNTCSTSIAAGGNHSVALQFDNTTGAYRPAVYAWGNNDLSQFGDGTNGGDSGEPVENTLLHYSTLPVTAVAAGEGHTIALVNGRVLGWGLNDYGQVGNGTFMSPMATPMDTGQAMIKSIAAGHKHSFAVHDGGEVFGWGRNDYGQLAAPIGPPDQRVPIHSPHLTNIVEISGGGEHSIAVNRAGGILSWGRNSWGQRGDGTTDDDPHEIPHLITIADSHGWASAVSVAAGYDFNLALTREGKVYSWGNNDHGQLGLGFEGSPEPSPQEIPGLSDIIAITAGYHHAMALSSDGTLYVWGSNDKHQLGIVDTTNVPTPTAHPAFEGTDTIFVSIEAGFYHSLATTSERQILAWGDNTHGQLGGGSGVVGGSQPTPARADTPDDLAGCATNLQCWSEPAFFGQSIEIANRTFETYISSGSHACGIEISSDDERQLFCHGDNLLGRVSPVPSGHFKELSVSAGFNCAIEDNGDIHCWGDLGTIPAHIPGPYRNISAGLGHACAINESDKSVDCWGNDANGMATPPSGVAFEDVTAGRQFTCGIVALESAPKLSDERRIQCWGSPTHYDEGPNKAFVQLSADGSYGSGLCGIAADGTTHCWGSDSTGLVSMLPTRLNANILNPREAAHHAQNHPCLDNSDADPSHRAMTIMMSHHLHDFAYARDAVDEMCVLQPLAQSYMWDNHDLGISGAGDHRYHTNLLNISGSAQGCCQGNFCSPCDYSDDHAPYLTETFDQHNMCPASAEVGVVAGGWPTYIMEQNSCRFPLDVSQQPDLQAPADVNATLVRLTYPDAVTINVPHISKNSGNGWYFTDQTRTEIQLSTSYCYDYLTSTRTLRLTTQVACYECPNVGEACDSAAATPGNACPEGVYVCREGQQYCEQTPARFASLSVGESMTCGVRYDDNSAICWGNSNAPDLPETTQFTQISARGWHHQCGVTSTGEIECWPTEWFSTDHGQLNAPSGTFEEVVTGGAFSCGLAADGEITCWGLDGDGIVSSVPNNPSNPFKTFGGDSAGYNHVCAIREDNSVDCWGAHPSSEIYSIPDLPFKKLSSLNDHICGLQLNNKIECWGDNSYGQSNAPIGLYKDVSAGFSNTCALALDGSLSCWGASGSLISLAPIGEQFIDISIGSGHGCGRYADGTLNCWGSNFHGQTDPMSFEDECPIPCFQHRNVLGTSCDVDGRDGRCSVGVWECCNAPYVDGQEGSTYCDEELRCKQLYRPMPETCTGEDDDCDGIIDNITESWAKDWEDADYHFTQAQIDTMREDQSELACNFFDACVCPPDAVRYTYPPHASNWQSDLYDEALDYFTDVELYHNNPPYIVPVGGANSCLNRIAAGKSTSAVLTADGDPYVWGRNHDTDIGLSPSGTEVPNPEPLQYFFDEGIAIESMTLGSGFGMAVTSTGSLYSWSHGNPSGILGHGNTDPYDTPTLVNALDDAGWSVTKVSALNAHALALVDEGRVFSWGDGNGGVLGHGDSATHYEPKIMDYFEEHRLVYGFTVVDIAAGNHHSLAVTSDGNVYSWGVCSWLGLNGFCDVYENAPIKIPYFEANDISIVSVSASDNFSLALSDNGKVYAWGRNFDGQAGNGTKTGIVWAPSPVTDLDYEGIVAISAGGSTSMALTADGRIFTWGRGDEGQLANGTTSDETYPYFVSDLTGINIVAIAAGSRHGMALSADGEVYTWGTGTYGELGDGAVDPGHVVPNPQPIGGFGDCAGTGNLTRASTCYCAQQ